jgi:hypothetical protein
MALDSDGNVFVSGSSMGNGGTGDSPYGAYDIYTAKYAAITGQVLWQRRFNGLANHLDEARAIALDGAGNVVLAGRSLTTNESRHYIAKYAAQDGTVLWEHLGPAGYLRTVAVTASDDIVVAGALNWTQPFDFYTAKHAPTDDRLLWEQRYNALANRSDHPQALALDDAGDVIVTGASVGMAAVDYYTAKYRAVNGSLIWESRYNGPANDGDFASALALDHSGNALVTGYSWNESDTDWLTVKYAAATGALLWERRFNGPSNVSDMAAAIVLDRDGNAFVTGSSDYHYHTVKYAAANGAMLWDRPGPAGMPRAAATDSQGNLVVTGRSTGTNAFLDCYTAKYAATDGALLWEQRYNGAANGIDEAVAASVDDSDDVVVTGRTFNGKNDDFYTAKYRGFDGLLIWERRYDGSGGSDGASALAIDRVGNVVVSGSTFNRTNSEFYTIKYAAADGEVLWERRGPKGISRAVAADSSGNVVITGSSVESYYNRDFYTAKYAAHDGAILWEQRYNGPVNGDDHINTRQCLALGGDGVTVVTGSSGTVATGSLGYFPGPSDYATVAYWEKLPSIGIAIVPAGVHLRFSGAPGRACQLQRATSASGPWVTIATIVAPEYATMEYLDRDSVGAAFYRLRTP